VFEGVKFTERADRRKRHGRASRDTIAEKTHIS
jgi:hypothetical protein